MPKILVIDDDAAVRHTVARMLRRGGYDVVLAEDGDEGLRLFRSENPELVITDIIMPEKEGLEAIREICRLRPDAKIIAMSGGGRIANVDFLSMAGRLGATEIIRKPFDPATLLDAVARCLATGSGDHRTPSEPPSAVA